MVLRGLLYKVGSQRQAIRFGVVSNPNFGMAKKQELPYYYSGTQNYLLGIPIKVERINFYKIL
jgi:hypothetical protein